MRAADDPTNPRLRGPYSGPLPTPEELSRLGVLKGFPRGTSPEAIEEYYRQRLSEVGYGAPAPSAADPMIADASPEFYAAWRELRSKYPTWTREQLFQAASAALQRRRMAEQEEFKKYAPEPSRPPQDTDPIRKLMEDARKQMDIQDRMRDAQKQIQLEALQREAMRNGEPVMWKDNKPFLPSQNPQAAEQAKADQVQKQIADQQEAFRRQQAEAARARKNRSPAFNPGMAQPIQPPSQGEQYGSASGYGDWVGQPEGPRPGDFRDQDGDGIDDRRQIGPGQPSHRHRAGQIARPGPDGRRFQF
jgi:hypothetical protein